MRKLIIWLIKTFLPGYHLHRDPLRKTDLKKIMGIMPDMEDGENKEGENG